MNTYNDNLRSTVFDSLQSQELDQKKLKAQLKASKISLYYAQGARIKASEKLEIAKDNLAFKSKVKIQAVKNNNISTNLLASATQESTYMKQAVSNSATGASNIQIAANAVLKLSSDVGSIYSIVKAADYGEEIYTHAKQAKVLMDKTAYDAELASQYAMMASTATSEVPYKAILEDSKEVDSGVKGILKIADAEYDKVSENVKDDNAAFATDSNKEKVVEGKLEDINVDFNAAYKAYNSLNKELNLNLSVVCPSMANPSSFKVNFNSITSPFQINTNNPSTYPVKNYYAVLIKYKNRAVFNISNAENLLLKSPLPNGKLYLSPVEIPAAVKESDSEGFSIDPVQLSVTMNLNEIVDSDGEDFVLGQNYVVCVFAEYNDSYKRTINDFEDFLSAPSTFFSLTNQLEVPAEKSIKVIAKEELTTITKSPNEITTTEDFSDELEGDQVNDKISNPKTIVSTSLVFDLTPETNQGFEVEYRCMLLPTSKELTTGLLTKSGLRNIEQEVENEELIAQNFYLENLKLEGQVANLETKANANELVITKLNSDIKNLKDDLKDSGLSSTVKGKKQDLINTKEESLKKLNLVVKKYTDAKTALNTLQSSRNTAVQYLNEIPQDTLGFYFDVDIAATVSAGNYMSHNVSSPIFGDGVLPVGINPTTTVSIPITAATTDNFGTPLIPGNEYVPVILAVSNANEINIPEYSNALTDYEKTDKFIYQAITQK